MGSRERSQGSKPGSSRISPTTRLVTAGSGKQRLLLLRQREPPIRSGASARTGGGAIGPSVRFAQASIIS